MTASIILNNTKRRWTIVDKVDAVVFNIEATEIEISRIVVVFNIVSWKKRLWIEV